MPTGRVPCLILGQRVVRVEFIHLNSINILYRCSGKGSNGGQMNRRPEEEMGRLVTCMLADQAPDRAKEQEIADRD